MISCDSFLQKLFVNCIDFQNTSMSLKTLKAGFANIFVVYNKFPVNVGYVGVSALFILATLLVLMFLR